MNVKKEKYSIICKSLMWETWLMVSFTEMQKVVESIFAGIGVNNISLHIKYAKYKDWTLAVNLLLNRITNLNIDIWDLSRNTRTWINKIELKHIWQNKCYHVTLIIIKYFQNFMLVFSWESYCIFLWFFCLFRKKWLKLTKHRKTIQGLLEQ